jgi:excisionase family DNA binding protein
MRTGSNNRVGQNVSDLSLLTPDEAAEVLRLSKASIYRLVERRMIPFHRVSGSLRFSRKDLEEYVLRGRVEPVS